MWLVNINCTDSEALQISLGTTFTISALFVEFTKNKFLQYGIVLLFCFLLLALVSFVGIDIKYNLSLSIAVVCRLITALIQKAWDNIT